MCAPKGPGTEVWHEFQRGFGVPDLIAVHPANDPEHKGWDIAKALAAGMGGSKAGVLESSFVAEVKSDLMGEQTILCGMLQAGTIACFDKMVNGGIAPAYAVKFLHTAPLRVRRLRAEVRDGRNWLFRLHRLKGSVSKVLRRQVLYS